jgi:hypothetical protein
MLCKPYLLGGYEFTGAVERYPSSMVFSPGNLPCHMLVLQISTSYILIVFIVEEYVPVLIMWVQFVTPRIESVLKASSASHFPFRLCG